MKKDKKIKETDENVILTEEQKRLQEDEELLEEYEKKQKRDRRDKIILIIIIIILLLLHFLCYKLGKIGYRDNISTSTIPGGTDSSSNKDDSTEKDSNSENIIEVIEIVNGDIGVVKDAQLNIFKNIKFDNQKIIAPGSNGIYKFAVKNLTGQNITYDINFLDAMTNPINMKYKLKIDNVYIRGNQNNYMNLSTLDTEDVIVVKDSINVFTLEWYWEHDDVKDTFVGSQKTDQYYTLNLKIAAEMYNE